MDVKIVRIDKSLPIPKYHTKGSVGFDLYAREKVVIKPKELAIVPLNCIIEVPKGYMLLLASRSSTPKKKGLMLANSVGIIDQDYHGPEDEIKALFYNFTDKNVTIEKGERLAQGIFVKVTQVNFKEVEKIKENSRGGFGATGH